MINKDEIKKFLEQMGKVFDESSKYVNNNHTWTANFHYFWGIFKKNVKDILIILLKYDGLTDTSSLFYNF